MLETEKKLCNTCAATTFGCLVRDAVIYFLRDGGVRSDLLSNFSSLNECPQSQDLLDESVPVDSFKAEYDDLDCCSENLDSLVDEVEIPPEDKKTE